jgi:GTP-binding protein
VDATSDDLLRDLDIVNKELKDYARGIEDRPQILVVNKIDLPEVRERMESIREVMAEMGERPLFISAAAGEGIPELIQAMAEELSKVEPEAKPDTVEAVIAPREEPVIKVAPEDGAFRVEGQRVVSFAEMMPLEDEDARAELWRRLGRWGVVTALRRAGARPGAVVRMGAVEVRWEA